MIQLERLIFTLVLGGAVLWLTWLEIHEGTASPGSWLWGVLAAVWLAAFVWRMAGVSSSGEQGTEQKQ